MTRRELRAMRQASEAATNQATAQPASTVTQEPAPTVAVPLSRTPAASAQSAEVAALMAEFDARYRPSAQPTADQVQPNAAVPPAPVAPVDLQPQVAPVSPVVPTPLVEPATPAPRAFSVEPPPQPVDRNEPTELREVVSAPEVFARPTGHWSTQATIDDEYQLTGHAISRDLSASDSVTTNALVLPSFVRSGPITAPVSGTGEILLTGSIDLPTGFGATGLHPSRYDRSDVDAIIDAADRDDSAPDSAPVRASRAVSTHTSSGAVMSAKRPRGNNLPMLLGIAAGVMGVGVVVLFVTVMISGIL